ncbi:MAG: metallo-mystery pair system four-Cys motif protein [Spirochaetia bacterium]|nr:metallo-mystery pair system four-Cys motif protein [Spirochaetia bacterium]
MYRFIAHALGLTLIASALNCNYLQTKDSDNNQTMALLALAMMSGSSSQTIPLSLVSSSSQVRCGGTFSIGATSNIQPQDLRFFISDVSMILPGGQKVAVNLATDGVWQYDNAALLDFEDATGTCAGGVRTSQTNTSIRLASTPSATYQGIEFTLGLPQRLNQVNNATAPSPLNVSGMYWAWASGYKFTRIEFVSGGTHQTHIGGSGTCTSPAACTKPMAATITVQPSGGFNPATQTLALDLNQMYSGGYTAGTGVMCMPGSGTGACDAMIANIGLNATTGASTGSQIAFSVK